MNGDDRYDVFCTNYGCFRYHNRDDMENPWPSWGAGVCAPFCGLWTHVRGPVLDVPDVGQCGPRGCGPIQPVYPGKRVVSRPVVGPFYGLRDDYFGA